MEAIFLKTLPFFALLGLGYWAGRVKFFPPEATAWLTRFVFYFALSAMLFRFSATLSMSEVLDWTIVGAYLWGTLTVYLIATGAAMLRQRPFEEVVMEAQVAVIGNTGFLGIPMLVLLLGPAAIGPVVLVLATDLIVFSSLLTILIAAHRDGQVSMRVLRAVGLGLARNPMIVAMAAGLFWAATGLELPEPADAFLTLLGGAATPGALFAIGASLAGRSASGLMVAGWLSFAKLVLHPAAVALSALVIFPVEQFAAGVMIAAASLPVAGNVYMLAAHYKVVPERVSAAILVSTLVSIVSVSLVIAWVST
ncbi:MAG TPA: AEC family transporter [Rhodobacteraceae bacterium]|nr:AEC family transporter [Paracoccaceae bacterium]